jgi:dihydrodipicolinate synthase/N-acetylneuraminate lyase
MDTQPVTPSKLAASVIAVPPLARDATLKVNLEQNRKIVKFIEAGGVRTLLYGGNAVFYHIRPSEYARVLEMLVDVAGPQTLVIPAVGPTYGMMMDQAEMLQDFSFPTVMVLPQKEIVDANGIAAGIRRFVDQFSKPVVLYLKHDQWLPASLVGKMYRSGIISWVKYAVVRDDPADDSYLREVLAEIPPEIVVSGIGEQPAVIHLRDFEVGSFTSGCVCVNPSKSMDMLGLLRDARWEEAEAVREQFVGLEDLRNAINPIRVLHRAVELAEIAETGPMLPLLGELTPEQVTAVATEAVKLRNA